MNKAPAAIDRDVVEQPLQRTLSTPREAFVNFPGLLGDMHMNGAIRIQLQQRQKFFRRYGAQRVWCNAKASVGQAICSARPMRLKRDSSFK